MAQTTITNDDIAALAYKLDAMADRFDEHERAALHAVFHLAGAAMCDAAVEVEGYLHAPGPGSDFAVTSEPWSTTDVLSASFEVGLHTGGVAPAPPTGATGDGAILIELTR